MAGALLINPSKCGKQKRKQRADARLVALCTAVTAIPSVCAVQHACTTDGHVMILFSLTDLRWLFVPCRATDRNYGGYGFTLEVHAADLPEHLPEALYFLLTTRRADDDLRGPALHGDLALDAAGALAERIYAWLADKEVLRLYGLRT